MMQPCPRCRRLISLVPQRRRPAAPKEMMEPCLLYLHLISLVPQRRRTAAPKRRPTLTNPGQPCPTNPVLHLISSVPRTAPGSQENARERMASNLLKCLGMSWDLLESLLVSPGVLERAARQRFDPALRRHDQRDDARVDQTGLHHLCSAGCVLPFGDRKERSGLSHEQQ